MCVVHSIATGAYQDDLHETTLRLHNTLLIKQSPGKCFSILIIHFYLILFF